jgi:hypothetical protein
MTAVVQYWFTLGVFESPSHHFQRAVEPAYVKVSTSQTWICSRLFEIAGVLVRLGQVASFIVNANHGMIGLAADINLESN